MPADSLIALFSILMASTWSPGPNNLMLASSGATFGFRATVPHITGVFLGFGFMLFSVALGMGEIFERFPVVNEILRYLGAVLLLWIAWRIANSKAPGEPGAKIKPFTFYQAAIFQWVNPKAWAMCIAVVGQFMQDEGALLLAVIFAFVAMTSGATSSIGWAAFGKFLQNWLNSPKKLRVFNSLMASIIVAGVIFVMLSGAGI